MNNNFFNDLLIEITDNWQKPELAILFIILWFGVPLCIWWCLWHGNPIASLWNYYKDQQRINRLLKWKHWAKEEVLSLKGLGKTVDYIRSCGEYHDRDIPLLEATWQDMEK